MINHIALKEKLVGNPDDCIGLLEEIGYEKIKYNANRNELRFAREADRNPTAVKFSLDTLQFVCFSTGDKGDVFTLVMTANGCSFPESIRYVAKYLGISEDDYKYRKTSLPFGGFFKKIAKEETSPEYAMETYDEEILNDYQGYNNLMFWNDGISFQTQAEFGVGYDFCTDRITVPEYTLSGELCGIMGRLNKLNCDKGERWLPIIPCSRSLTLYGYHRNYADIQQKGVVVIGESEKFVQQLHSMGCGIGLSICGCNISATQAKHIKSLMTKKTILALDEGLAEDQVRAEAEKLLSTNRMLNRKVGYIYDKDNDVLLKGGKQSPADLGKKAFCELYKNHVVWLN